MQFNKETKYFTTDDTEKPKIFNHEPHERERTKRSR